MQRPATEVLKEHEVGRKKPEAKNSEGLFDTGQLLREYGHPSGGVGGHGGRRRVGLSPGRPLPQAGPATDCWLPSANRGPGFKTERHVPRGLYSRLPQ